MLRPLLTAALALPLTATAALAALPPWHQNAKDLDVMVAFIKAHQRVAGTLRSIDLQTYSVRFDRSCVAHFMREQVKRPPGWVGPQAPLVFHHSNCALD
jgi:hypothetical protein